MTLQEYCRELGWDASELARQSGMNYRTARKALNGEEISARRARQIAKTLSQVLGQTIYPGDIDGLIFK